MTPKLRPGLQRGDSPGEPARSMPEPDAPDATPVGAVPATRQCDEAASEAARRWYRVHRIEAMAPDCRIEPMLAAGESVYVVRRASLLDQGRAPRSACTAGDLYVTSQRLLHVGERTMGVDLDAIGEVVLTGDGLAVTTMDGGSVLLHVDEPRLLRVQIAAARTAHRCGAKAPAQRRSAGS